MKKALSVILSASMVLAMAAPAFAESATEAPDLDGSDFSVGLVTDVGGVNDGSFNQSAWEGLQKAGEDFGVTVNYLESKTDADYTPNIESFMDEDCDLIICVGYMLADAMRSAAEENPDQKFAIIDDSSCSDLDNVTCLMFRQEQASYLVGYVAGLVTETNTVGFVLGMANDTMNQFGYGYLAGVKDANPDATILRPLITLSHYLTRKEAYNVCERLLSISDTVIFASDEWRQSKGCMHEYEQAKKRNMQILQCVEKNNKMIFFEIVH